MDEDGDAEFHDALEDHEDLRKPEVSDVDMDYTKNIIEIEDDGHEEEHQAVETRAEEEVEDDLFQMYFGKNAKSPPVSDDEDCNSDASISNIKSKQRGISPFDPVDHINDACNSRAASTPPPSVKRESTTSSIHPATAPSTEPLSLIPNPVTDLSPAMRSQTKLHIRGKQLIPKLELASHRYWIGVLLAEKKPYPLANLTEKHFVWMRGNRLSTIETIWHTYALQTMSEKFVLLSGWEKMAKDIVAEEMDWFNDQVVILRAVPEHTIDAKGRLLGEGVPIELIELIDD